MTGSRAAIQCVIAQPARQRVIPAVPFNRISAAASEQHIIAAPAAVLIGAVIDGKVSLTAAVSKDLIAKDLHSGECVKAAAEIVGGGGGRSDMAKAGGKAPSKLPDALKAGADYFRAKLE